MPTKTSSNGAPRCLPEHSRWTGFRDWGPRFRSRDAPNRRARAEVSSSSRPPVRAKDRLAKRLFADPDSIGFSRRPIFGDIGNDCLGLDNRFWDFCGLARSALFVGLLDNPLPEPGGFDLAYCVGRIACVAGPGSEAWRGDLVLGVAFLSLFVLIFVLATLVFVRPITRGYRVALAGAGLGIGSTLLLLIADPLAAAPIVQTTEPYAMILFCVLVVWRAIDSARRKIWHNLARYLSGLRLGEHSHGLDHRERIFERPSGSGSCGQRRGIFDDHPRWNAEHR